MSREFAELQQMQRRLQDVMALYVREVGQKRPRNTTRALRLLRALQKSSPSTLCQVMVGAMMELANDLQSDGGPWLMKDASGRFTLVPPSQKSPETCPPLIHPVQQYRQPESGGWINGYARYVRQGLLRGRP